jgi:hypothetical protein
MHCGLTSGVMGLTVGGQIRTPSRGCGAPGAGGSTQFAMGGVTVTGGHRGSASASRGCGWPGRMQVGGRSGVIGSTVSGHTGLVAAAPPRGWGPLPGRQSATGGL